MQLENIKKMVIHLEESKRDLSKLKKTFPDVEEFKGYYNQDGARGISDSFKGVILRSLSEEYVLIFEDDVKFQSENSILQFQKAINSLPEDWDILIGGSYWTEEKVKFNDYLD